MKVISRLSTCQICRIIFSVFILLDLFVLFDTNNKLVLETLPPPPWSITTQYLFYSCFSNHSEKIQKKKQGSGRKLKKKEVKERQRRHQERRRKGRTRKWRGKSLFMIKIIISQYQLQLQLHSINSNICFMCQQPPRFVLHRFGQITTSHFSPY